MNEYEKTSKITLENEKSKKIKDAAENLASKLHHLKSTKTTPGIYNAPGKTYNILGKKADDFLASTFKVK